MERTAVGSDEHTRHLSLKEECMEPSTATTAAPQIPPPPGGGNPVSNPQYRQSADLTTTPVRTPPTPPGGGTPVVNPHFQVATSTQNLTPPPPPGGGQPVPNPHYQTTLPSISATDSSIPAFIRNGVDMKGVTQTVNKPNEADQGAIADVHSDDPEHVHVFDTGAYNSDTRNHELTHVFQDTRSPDITTVNTHVGKDVVDNTSYDYGGKNGLQKARKGGKTIANFGVEQQAQMVRDYKQEQDAFLQKVKSGKATPKDLQAMSDSQQAYHPFMEQMANMPGKDARIHPGYINLLLGRNMPTLDARPEAPGLPSFATPGMGMATPDPLMGGHAELIHKRK